MQKLAILRSKFRYILCYLENAHSNPYEVYLDDWGIWIMHNEICNITSLFSDQLNKKFVYVW